MLASFLRLLYCCNLKLLASPISRDAAFEPMTGSFCSVAVDTSDLLVQCLCGCSHCCVNTEVQHSVPARQKLKEARPLKHKHKSQHLLVLYPQEASQKTTPHTKDFEQCMETRKNSVNISPRSSPMKKRSFQCDLCKAEFSRKHSLTVHLQKHMCQQGQQNVDPLERSLAVPCNNLKVAPIDASIQKELLNSLGTIKHPRCEMCGMVFHNPSALATHRSVYAGNCNRKCNICGKYFATHSCLQAHAASHRSLKAFGCELCGSVFAKKDSLTTHLRKHTGERPFSCDICGAAFNRRFTLNNHRALHSSDRPHVCAACGKAFLTRAALLCHERTTHTRTPSLLSTRKRPQDYLPVVCDQCGKVYSNAANLRIHKRTHTGLRPFLCPVCGTAFGKKYTLQCHMRRHTNERPFSCEDCGAAFFRRSTLATHRHRHTGERPHRCALCGQGFIQSASLAYHLEHHEHALDPQPLTGAQRTSRGQVKRGRFASGSS